MAYGMTRENDNDWREREKANAKALKNKPLKAIHIERAANGGHIVEHRFDNSGGGPYKDAEQHVFSTGKEMLAHVAKHMGVSMGKSASEGENESED